MKKTLLVLGFSIITIISKEQSLWNDISKQGGFYNESDFYRHASSQIPDLQAWVSDPTQQFYMEARYGYEDIYTGALYVGVNLTKIRWFLNSEIFDLTIMGGGVSGQVNGYSGAFTFEATSKNHRFNLESENEYVYSIDSLQRPSFLYDWSKATYSFGSVKSRPFGVGAGMQWEGMFRHETARHLFYLGPMVRLGISPIVHFDIIDYYDYLNRISVYTVAVDIE